MPIERVLAAGRYFEAEPAINCGMRIAGEVVATTITPDGIFSRTIHRFADYEEACHAGAAIVARFESAARPA